MKIKYKHQIFALLFIAAFGVFVFACAEAERDNQYDPNSPNYVFAVYVSTTGIDTPNCGTSEYPCKTIQHGISRAPSICDPNPRQVRVATGTYSGTSPVVTMVNGTSIYGGYGGETIIEDTSATGGTSFINANRTIDCSASISTATFIDGFTIKGGGGTYAAAIFCNSVGSFLRINNNKIYGGSSNTGRTYGIINYSSSPTITNNYIYGGDGNLGSSLQSYGIFNDGSASTCSPVIRKNTIDGGKGFRSTGIYDNMSTGVKIISNNISGGEGRDRSHGIAVYTSTSGEIINNIIFGGRGGDSIAYPGQTYGLYISASSPVIYNNTIDGGYSRYSNPTAIYCIYLTSSSTPKIDNNILTVERFSASLVEYGIFEGDAGSDPISVRNNDIYNCRAALYHDEIGATDYDYNQVNGSGNFTDGSNTLSTPIASYNISGDPAFQNAGSGVEWANVNLHLTASSPLEARQGGLNGKNSSENWSFSIDIEDNLRTPSDTVSTLGWSMGAYEYN